MSVIKINYSEVLTEADKLAGFADRGEQYLREMKNISNSIPSFWTGQASNAFVNLCVQEEGELVRLINTLDNISRNLKMIADDIKAADERAKIVINSK